MAGGAFASNPEIITPPEALARHSPRGTTLVAGAGPATASRHGLLRGHWGRPAARPLGAACCAADLAPGVVEGALQTLNALRRQFGQRCTSIPNPLPLRPQPAAAPSVISSPAGRRWLPANRWARRALYGVAGLLGLGALGWLAVPPLLKWQGEQIASEQLGRAVRIGAVDFKPWTLELTLNDVAVGGAAGAPDQLSVKRIYANAALQSLFRLAPVVDAIQVEAPALRLTHLGDGHYDIDDILAKLAARPQPAEATEPARFALYNIDLSGGRIDFDDRAVKRQHEVRDLRLTLPFVSNLPSERQIKVQPQLAFVANGSAFDSRAEALPFADSRQTDAAFRLTQLDLKPYLGYWPASLPIKLQSAVIDADLRLDFEQTPKPSLRLSGALAVSGLKSVDGQGADALAFDALKVQLAEVRLLQRKVHVSSVELHGPQLALRRLKDGQFNLLARGRCWSANWPWPAATLAGAMPPRPPRWKPN